MKKYLNLSAMDKKELAEFISLTHDDTELYNIADKIRRENYDDKVYIRGLIEVSSYCQNNCFYCGIRAGNKNAMRYRLNQDEILSCCKVGYDLGFRTFVMQGGEDNHFTDEFMCSVIYKIKSLYPDCAITLSLGERTCQSYKALKNAGADRYLLRHETANDNHYSRLHPQGMKLSQRKECLFNLKELGYQVGSGFMVGSPYQTWETLAEDLLFLKELQPQMIGIGPFISHKDTPFKNEKSGSLYLTLKLVSMLRIMFPKALIPATTALSSISPQGREMGLKAGANVVMPNLSPQDIRSKYNLYDNKAYSGSEAAESLEILKNLVENAGYRVVIDRGDALSQ